jgi:hypothetical protein
MKRQNYNRRQFTTQLIGGAISMGLAPSLFAQSTLVTLEEINWFDVKEIGVEGKGWTNTKRFLIVCPRKRKVW